MRHRTLIPLLAALGFVCTALVCTARASAQPAPTASVPPPPGIDDPGVQPAISLSIPALPSMQDATHPGPPPEVTVRKEEGDVIQEYSHNGHIFMIRIIPENGVTQTFIDTDGDGRLDPDPGEGSVSPVYYTIYEWD